MLIYTRILPPTLSFPRQSRQLQTQNDSTGYAGSARHILETLHSKSYGLHFVSPQYISRLARLVFSASFDLYLSRSSHITIIMGSVTRTTPLNEQLSILYVDCFDSFTNNIIGLLEERLGANVIMVRIDDKQADRDLHTLLRAVDGVVIGPGPGHPRNTQDVGFINKLWALSDSELIPIFGICLGFQSLCLNHGADVKRLESPRHGIVSRSTHQGTDILKGLGDLDCTQYHSLHADLELTGAPPTHFWQPNNVCPDLLPLAWDLSDENNGPVLMVVRHISKPFWGCQFHPESICTSEAGKDLLVNWWRHALRWSANNARVKTMELTGRYLPNSLSSLFVDAPIQAGHLQASHLAQELRSAAGRDDIFLRWAKYPAQGVTPTVLLEKLGHRDDEVILLDSQGHNMGRFDILGLVVPGKTANVTYSSYDRTLRYGNHSKNIDSIEECWPLFQEALDIYYPQNQKIDRSKLRSDMDRFIAGHLPADSPFWGGFMGYISYEAGLETIDVRLPEKPTDGLAIPDINFAFIHRSIVIDHHTNQIYVQSLLPNDWTWILRVGSLIDSVSAASSISECLSPTSIAESRHLNDTLTHSTITRPTGDSYRAQVQNCQDHLRAGDSYELCLTDESSIVIPSDPSSHSHSPLDAWSLYKKMRLNNPAPHGAYLNLPNISIVGTSPERFLSWSRGGHCQFRPIKGTVKKDPGMTHSIASEILNSSKERAENLMIVDLIRHDLSGVVGADNTWVSKLMVMEEYEKVYQLVSVIEGQLPPAELPGAPRGLHVLKNSLPPGSMTGAPKKRSCEILVDLEKRPRGVYAGVLGYMDVGGAGDFAVVIRTLVRNKLEEQEVWRIGAGGAVTIQSTDEGEFEEMEIKAGSVLESMMK
ncbi:para-aminobenzoic acid synthetase [Neurospora intermedia]|uniref:aminodeoxychorismate synthase n=1 Tax=Neurospora intermedia TaxID=5142 RepID=A0ABR3CZD7_NEUIN